MPLTREQRLRVTSALRWARDNGWTHGAWNGTWRNDTYWVGFDPEIGCLILDHTAAVSPLGNPLPFKLRRAKVMVESVDQALDVLAALGVLHPGLSPMVNRCVEEAVEPASGQPDVYAHDFDGPASFAAAGEAFADLVNGSAVTARRAAEVLSTLAREGLIVSTEYHDETTAELAAHDLRFGDVPDLADLAMVLSGGEYVPLDEEQP